MKDCWIIIRKTFGVFCTGLLFLIAAPYIVLKYYFGFKKISRSSPWSNEGKEFYKGLSEKEKEMLNQMIF